MNILFIDLEMNQPSQQIIQVGWTIGDPISGRVYSINGSYVHLWERLDPFISDLCGIQQNVLDKSPVLLDVYSEMLDDFKRWDCTNKTGAWGEGDLRLLRKQVQRHLDTGTEWPFGRDYINVKSVYQTWKLKNGDTHLKGGLARGLSRLGLKFDGRKHDAKDDAYNTFHIYRRLLQELR